MSTYALAEQSDAQPVSRYTQLARPLFDVAMQQSGHARLVINGISMLPLARPGDAIQVESVQPDDLCAGDVIVLWCDNSFLTHRLAMIDATNVYTKGDNQRLFDPPVRLNSVVGRVTSIERGHLRVDLTSPLWRKVQWLYGALLVVEFGWLRSSPSTHSLVARSKRIVAWLVQMLLGMIISVQLWYSQQRGNA